MILRVSKTIIDLRKLNKAQTKFEYKVAMFIPHD